MRNSVQALTPKGESPRPGRGAGTNGSPKNKPASTQKASHSCEPPSTRSHGSTNSGAPRASGDDPKDLSKGRRNRYRDSRHTGARCGGRDDKRDRCLCWSVWPRVARACVHGARQRHALACRPRCPRSTVMDVLVKANSTCELEVTV